MKTLATFFISATLVTCAAPAAVETQLVLPASAEIQPGLIESLQHESQAAIARGSDWLLKQQQPDGHWSSPNFPALTALPLWALCRAPCSDTQALDRAVNFILTCVHPDGSIFREPAEERKGGGLPNYNTAICMVALHATGRPELRPIILRARDYMAKNQHLTGDDMYYGGFGYDPATGRAYTDLSNSYLAYEAMKLTEDVEDFRPNGEPKTRIDWDAAIQYLEKVQNDPAVNQQAWVATDPDEQGGFVYRPDQTRAGIVTDSNGIVRFRSMPGMSYAGLLSYIYAKVSRDDPRVRATINWIKNHFNLNQSSRDPAKSADGRDQEGLFYMYNVMSKGLDAYGVDVFTPDNGPAYNWRAALTERLLADQKINPDGTGYWINPVSRYWEGDPILVTSYALLALEMAR